VKSYKVSPEVKTFTGQQRSQCRCKRPIWFFYDHRRASDAVASR